MNSCTWMSSSPLLSIFRISPQEFLNFLMQTVPSTQKFPEAHPEDLPKLLAKHGICCPSQVPALQPCHLSLQPKAVPPKKNQGSGQKRLLPSHQVAMCHLQKCRIFRRVLGCSAWPLPSPWRILMPRRSTKTRLPERYWSGEPKRNFRHCPHSPHKTPGLQVSVSMCETSRLLIFFENFKKNSLAFTSQWDRLFSATNLTKCQPFSFGSKKQTCQSKPLAFFFVALCAIWHGRMMITWHVAHTCPARQTHKTGPRSESKRSWLVRPTTKKWWNSLEKQHNDFQEVNPKKMCSPFMVEGQLHVSVLPN